MTIRRLQTCCRPSTPVPIALVPISTSTSPFMKAVQPGFVFARVEADLPSFLDQRVAQQAVDAVDVVGVNERFRLDVVEDHRQAGAGKDLLQSERAAPFAQSADFVEERAAVHFDVLFVAPESCTQASSECRA